MQEKVPTYLLVSISLLLCISALFFAFIPLATEPYSDINSRTGFDFFGYFLPKYIYGTEEVLAGRLPIWNRYEYSGIPFLATAQPAVLYPPKIIAFALLRPEIAYQVFLFFHYCAMALFFLLFIRDQGISAIGAMTGSAFWTFAHLILIANYHPVRIANMVWIPLIFLLVERLAKRPSRWPFIALAAVVATQIAVGYPEVFVDLSILIAVYSTVRWLTGDWKSPPWKSVPLIAAAFLLAVFLTSFQILPLAELAMTSKRVDFIEVGAIFTTETILNSMLRATLFPFPALFAFVLLGCSRSKAKPAVTGTLFCFFMSTGGWILVRQLPGLENIRFPYVWVYVILFFLAWLAAAGMDAYLQDGRRRLARWSNRWVVGIGATVWAAVCAIPLYWLFTDRQKLLPAWSKFNLIEIIGRTDVAIGLTVCGALLMVAVVFFQISARPHKWLVFLTLVVITLGQTASYPRSIGAVPMRQPQKRSTVARMYGDLNRITGRTFSLFDVRHGYALTERIESLIGSEISFLPWRFRLVFLNLGLHSFFDFPNWERFASAQGFLDAMNLQVVIAPVSHSSVLVANGLMMRRYRPRIDALFENTDRMGHAWINYGVRVVDSSEKALISVFSRDFDPRREVVLERFPANRYPEIDIPTATPVENFRRKSPTETEYRVRLDRPGLLVVSESGYPGWLAFVDGKPTEWLQADFILRAVELPSGEHTVRFEYRPWWISVATIMTLCGVLVIFGLLFWNQWSPLVLRKRAKSA
jgi:hypothetical protein